ncbi:MAG: hypothetical protein HZB26_12430 [Candidatus Hydrogenedentes bacterium]|nr:hypothetical protein [Candidatus Hydrogenedentota bacterium]
MKVELVPMTIPNFSHLPMQSRIAARLRVFWIAFRHWQSWIGLAILLSCMSLGGYLGSMIGNTIGGAGYARTFGIAVGVTVGAFVGNFAAGYATVFLARVYATLRDYWVDKRRRDGPLGGHRG